MQRSTSFGVGLTLVLMDFAVFHWIHSMDPGDNAPVAMLTGERSADELRIKYSFQECSGGCHKTLGNIPNSCESHYDKDEIALATKRLTHS